MKIKYSILIFALLYLKTIVNINADKNVILNENENILINKLKWSAVIVGRIGTLGIKLTCGATFFTDSKMKEIKWMVTAAHCFFPIMENRVYKVNLPYLWSVTAGTGSDRTKLLHIKSFKQLRTRKFVNWNRFNRIRNRLLGTNLATGQPDLYVDRIIVHSNYTLANHQNDIALLRLSRSLTNDEKIKVQPILLDNNLNMSNQSERRQHCILIGGKLNQSSFYSRVLVKLHFVNDSYCIRTFLSSIRSWNKNSIVCAQSLSETGKVGLGDSGSGLACYNGQTWSLVGITSAVDIKQSGKESILFSKISHFKHWITTTLSLN